MATTVRAPGPSRFQGYINNAPEWRGARTGPFGNAGETYLEGDVIRVGSELFIALQTADGTEINQGRSPLDGAPWWQSLNVSYDIEEGNVIGFPLGNEIRQELIGSVRNTVINLSYDETTLLTGTFRNGPLVTDLVTSTAELATLLGIDDEATLPGTNLVFRFEPQGNSTEHFRSIIQIASIDNAGVVSLVELDDQPINDMVGDGFDVQKWAVLQDITQTFTQLSRTPLVGFPPTVGNAFSTFFRVDPGLLDAFINGNDDISSDADLENGVLISFGDETERYRIIDVTRSSTNVFIRVAAGGTPRSDANTPIPSNIVAVLASTPTEFRQLVAGAGVAFANDPATDELVISATAAAGGALTTDGNGGIFVANNTVSTDFRRVLTTGTNSDGLDSLHNFSNVGTIEAASPALLAYLTSSALRGIAPTVDETTGARTINTFINNSSIDAVNGIINDGLTPGDNFIVDFVDSITSATYKIVSAYSRPDSSGGGSDLYFSFRFVSSTLTGLTEMSSFNSAIDNAGIISIDTAATGLVTKLNATSNDYGVTGYQDIANTIQPLLNLNVAATADRVFDFFNVTGASVTGRTNRTDIEITITGDLPLMTESHILDLTGTAGLADTVIFRVPAGTFRTEVDIGTGTILTYDSSALTVLEGSQRSLNEEAGTVGYAAVSMYSIDNMKVQGYVFEDDLPSSNDVGVVANVTADTDTGFDVVSVGGNFFGIAGSHSFPRGQEIQVGAFDDGTNLPVRFIRVTNTFVTFAGGQVITDISYTPNGGGNVVGADSGRSVFVFSTRDVPVHRITGSDSVVISRGAVESEIVLTVDAISRNQGFSEWDATVTYNPGDHIFIEDPTDTDVDSHNHVQFDCLIQNINMNPTLTGTPTNLWIPSELTPLQFSDNGEARFSRYTLNGNTFAEVNHVGSILQNDGLVNPVIPEGHTPITQYYTEILEGVDRELAVVRSACDLRGKQDVILTEADIPAPITREIERARPKFETAARGFQVLGDNIGYEANTLNRRQLLLTFADNGDADVFKVLLDADNVGLGVGTLSPNTILRSAAVIETIVNDIDGAPDSLTVHFDEPLNVDTGDILIQVTIAEVDIEIVRVSGNTLQFVDADGTTQDYTPTMTGGTVLNGIGNPRALFVSLKGADNEISTVNGNTVFTQTRDDFGDTFVTTITSPTAGFPDLAGGVTTGTAVTTFTVVNGLNDIVAVKRIYTRADNSNTRIDIRSA